ncbi:YcxB family protein [Desulfitobacterium sp. THU1]|uniref:YcxB family protein n=1 Tax=Desulfitobacterium sp. THU1 TaxID=3138072 RepID=UPI00311FA16D
MEITYYLSEEDYLKFNLFHIKNSEPAKQALKKQRFLGPAIFMTFAAFLSIVGSRPYQEVMIMFTLLSVLWFIYYPKYFYRYITRNSKTLLKAGNNDDLFGEHHMVLAEEGIIDTTAQGETKLNWAGIQAINQDEDNLYLYNSSISAYILPKRDIDDPKELKRMLEENTKKALFQKQ